VSLVSEALRKARQEAAERGAARKGVIIRTTVMLPSRRLGLAAGPAAALGGLAALVVVGAAFAWWALGRNHAGTAPSARPGATAPVASVNAPLVAAPAPTAAPLGAASAARGAAPPPPLAEPPSAPQQAPEPPSRATVTESAAAPAGAEKRAAVPVQPSPQPHTRASETSAAPERDSGDKSAAGERSFLLTADLGNVKLTLDYIAYQPSRAFAGINGHEVVVGSLIEGIRVEEIGPDYVRLRDRHGLLYLRSN
jgi:hypothetical protein